MGHLSQTTIFSEMANTRAGNPDLPPFGAAASVRSGYTTPVAAVLLCLTAGVFVAQLYLFAGYGIGDGYITARYAENLSDHGEFAFNRGERINAITSPLHMLFLSLLHTLGGNTLIWNKIFAPLGLLAGTLFFAWRFRPEPTAFILSIYVTALSPFLILWTFSGLETAYVFAGVAVFCALMIDFKRKTQQSKSIAAIGIVASALFLLRFETILLTGPACIYAISSSRQIFRSALIVATPALFCAFYLAFSFFYFGDILPTSFYHKTPSYGSATIALNALYGIQFLLISGLPVAFLALRNSGTAPAEDPRSAEIQKAQWWIPVALGLLAIFWLGAATKHMMYGYRIFLPYLPLLFLAVHAVGTLSKSPRWPFFTFQSTNLLLFLILGGSQLFLCLVVYHHSLNPSLFGEFRHKGAIQQMLPEEHADVLKKSATLRRHWARAGRGSGPGPRLFTKEAGKLPYYFRESVVLDQGLISHRHNCKVDLRASADYVEIWFPAWGSLESQLPRPLSEMILVFPERLPPTDVPYKAIFYNPNPMPYRLPPSVGGNCVDR